MKDKRLYARMDIAMDEHPKIMCLSDAAFRALHEATYYSRRQLTDGFLPERVALRKWKRKVLEELTKNHPERPSLTRVEGGWQIWDFEEHQTTSADIQAKAAAGRKGGRAKAENVAAGKVVAGATNVPTENGKQNTYENVAKTETETETETNTTSNEVVGVVDATPPAQPKAKRATRIPDPFIVTSDMRAWAAEKTPDVDVNRTTERFVNYWRGKSGKDATKLDWLATWRNWLDKDQEDREQRQARAEAAKPVQRKPPKARTIEEIEAHEALMMTEEGVAMYLARSRAGLSGHEGTPGGPGGPGSYPDASTGRTAPQLPPILSGLSGGLG